jgi:hypothetical protein
MVEGVSTSEGTFGLSWTVSNADGSVAADSDVFTDDDGNASSSDTSSTTTGGASSNSTLFAVVGVLAAVFAVVIVAVIVMYRRVQRKKKFEAGRRTGSDPYPTIVVSQVSVFRAVPRVSGLVEMQT